MKVYHPYLAHRLQAGDTIVEVIIAVMIVATILAGASTVTNRSTRAVRDAEEHAQALQLLQGQVELLRHAAAIPQLPSSISTSFCLSTGAYYQPANTSPQCLVNTQGLSGQADSIYQLSISSPSSSANANGTTIFNLVASWPSLSGGTNTVYLAYKVQVAQ